MDLATLDISELNLRTDDVKGLALTSNSALCANYFSKIYDKPNILLIFAENWKYNYIITNNMVIDDKILDQLIDFLEAHKKYGFMRPSIEAGEYKGYKIRVELRTPDDELNSEANH